MRVTFVCQWYAPEPGHQPMWIVDALRRRGAEVTVLTGLPNYPDGVLHPGYHPLQRSREVRDGVVVHRTPLYPSHDRSTVRRVANYLSWALSASLLGGAASADADVALVYSSPATAALPAMVRRRRTPYVLLVQDVWPDSVTASGFLAGRPARPAVRLLDRWVSRTYAGAAAVVVTSPGMVTLLCERGVPAERLHLVPNWVAEPGPVAPGGLPEAIGPGAFTVLYAGNHGAAQDLGPIVDAVVALPAEHDVHLVMVGDGVEKPELARRAAGCDRVHLLEPRSAAEVAAMAAAADVQLVALADRPLFAVTTPSKLQAMLAAGSPVLAVATGDVARLVTEHRLGAAVRPGRPAELTAALLALRALPAAELAAMGARGRQVYEGTMAEEVGAARLTSVLATAAGRERVG